MVRRLAASLTDLGYFADFDLGADGEQIEGGIAPTDAWWSRLKVNIASADVVVFVLSPAAIKSRVCDDEVAWAQTLGKKIIPIIWKRIDFRRVPARLSELNISIPFSKDAAGRHLPFKGEADALARLCASIDKDIEWVREGRRLTELANYWRASGEAGDLLLRAGAIAAASAWVARRPKSEPVPGEVLQAFLARSQSRETEDRDRLRKAVGRAFLEPIKAAVVARKYDKAMRLMAGAAVLADDVNFSLVPEVWRAGALAISRSALRVAFHGHGAVIHALAWAPGSDEIATGGEDKNVRIWSLEDGVERHCLSGHRGSVHALQYLSCDRIVSGGGDSKAFVWSLESGEILGSVKSHESSVNALASLGDGGFATASTDSRARFWSSSIEETSSPVEGLFNPHALAFLADGSMLATYPDGLGVFDRQTQTKRSLISGRFASFAMAGRAGHVVTLGYDGAVVVWDIATGAVLRELKAGNDKVVAIAINETAHLVAGGTDSGVILLWNIESGKERAQFPAHDAGIRAVAFSEDGKLLATAGYDKIARVWDTQNAIGPRAIALRERAYYKSVAAIADHRASARAFLVGQADGRLCALDARAKGVVRAVQVLKSIEHLSAPRGACRVVVGSRRSIAVCDATSLECRVRIEACHEMERVQISSDGEVLLLCTRDSDPVVYDAGSGAQRAILTHYGREVSASDVSANGRVIATGDNAGFVRLWNSITGDLLIACSDQDAPISQVRFSPDGMRLASTSGEMFGPKGSSVRLWDAADGRELCRHSVHQMGVSALLFADDGATFVSTGMDGVAYVWDAQTGRQISSLPGHENLIEGVCYDASGARLATVTRHRVRVWDAHAGSLLWEVDAPSHAPIWCAFANDEELLTCGSSGELIVWSLPQFTEGLSARTEMLKSRLAAGVGTLTSQERAHILLEMCPPDLSAALTMLTAESR